MCRINYVVFTDDGKIDVDITMSNAKEESDPTVVVGELIRLYNDLAHQVDVMLDCIEEGYY